MATEEPIYEGSVLDLPIERQKELAKLMGFSSFDDWVVDIKKSHAEAVEFVRKIDEGTATRQEGELPEGWTQETLDNWISKMSS